MKISYLSPKVGKEKSRISGFGIFAKSDIKKGELLSVFGGIILPLEKVKKLPQNVREWSPIQVSDGFFIGVESEKEFEDSDYFNHSCEPNAGVKGQILLVSRRDIKKGEEITFDYGTVDSRLSGFFCACGAKNCRKKISPGDWKDKNFQKNNKGYFSWYLEERIRQSKS